MTPTFWSARDLSPLSFSIALLCLVALAAGSPAAHADPIHDAVLQAEQQRIAAVAKAVQSAVAVFANEWTRPATWP